MPERQVCFSGSRKHLSPHSKMANKMAGYVYLLHFEKPICPTHPAQHYVGWTKVLKGESKGQKITNVFALFAKTELKGQISFFVGNAIPLGRNITVFKHCEIQLTDYLFPHYQEANFPIYTAFMSLHK